MDIHKIDISEKGFTVIDNVYTKDEIERINTVISSADNSSDTFRKSKDIFAIRQFLKEVPETIPVIFNEKLNRIIRHFFGEKYFVVKSIYFDKPQKSNWFVAYHQDLTISVDKRVETDGYGPWTVKLNQFAVQPPIDVLENIFTVRIHLDDTDENNGALKVVPGSHAKKIYRPETIDWSVETEATCNVNAGGIMIMKPLLLHSQEGQQTTTGEE
jgi:ectoine hydroxylase-related dioxygenase (phytanoyl-CoA dioxygenase family)